MINENLYLPRPLTSSRRGKGKFETKQQRYRRRNILCGLCPHCGKPCAPYYECDDRRLKHGFDRALRELIKIGMVGKTEDGRFYSITAERK